MITHLLIADDPREDLQVGVRVKVMCGRWMDAGPCPDFILFAHPFAEPGYSFRKALATSPFICEKCTAADNGEGHYVYGINEQTNERGHDYQCAPI